MKSYEPVHTKFEKFCRARVYGEMQHGDLINETLIIAYEKFTGERNSKQLLSFLIGISMRILANDKRKMKPETGIINLSTDSAIAAQKTESLLEVRMLHEAIAKLSEDQKEAIILFEITGYSIKEIAEMCSTSESSVRQRLRRGRMRLKELLAELPKTEQNYG